MPDFLKVCQFAALVQLVLFILLLKPELRQQKTIPK